MIHIKDSNEVAKMVTVGNMLAIMFEQIKDQVIIGISTAQLDKWIEEYQLKHKLTSCSKGYMGYKHVSCISLNDEVVHGIPNHDNKIKDGDLVKIDICVSYDGYCADMARCFFAGDVSQSVKNFVQTAYESLDNGISEVIEGQKLTNISAAIQKCVENKGYGIVREFAGHGIGKKMHEDPEVLNFGKPGCGPIMRPGMAFAIEPMITMGNYPVYVSKDGWTVKTKDRSLAAHVEDTVIVTSNGPLITTRF